ncbi:sigma-70 family RNA polymerase sigma factor [Polyangium jinanense]|uniref:RNA polymerase sigma factor n=1 Tax=Polyangium jinanense TaxID=2829994 RepID=UPI0023403CCF|nr:RNA polymerase sigma factor [Polyangium jinanense]MDC3956926.1 sigma-70 family RNA polymerase sigma factor [Polyangium jinanense]
MNTPQATAPTSSTPRWQAALAAVSLALLSVLVLLPLAVTLLALWAGVLGLASAWALDAIGARETHVVEGAVVIAASLLGLTGLVALIGAIVSVVRKLGSRGAPPRPAAPPPVGYYVPPIPPPKARSSWYRELFRHPWLSLGGVALFVDGCVVPFQASRVIRMPPVLLGGFILAGATLLFLFAAALSTRGWWLWMRSLWAGVRRSAFFAGLVTAGSLAVSVIALLIGNALGQVASALSAQEMARALETCSGSTTACSRQVVQGALGGKPRSLAPAPSGEITTPEVQASFDRCIEEIHQKDNQGRSLRSWAVLEAYRVLQNAAEAEDVVHEVMVSVCLISHRVAEIRPYFVRSVQNAAKDTWHRNRHFCPMVPDEPDWLPDACILPSIEQELILKATGKAAQDALCHLSGEERQVIELHVWDGLSHAEVARRLRISELAARKRYSRAREALEAKFYERCR